MHAGWPYLDDTIALMIVYPQVYADLGAINWIFPGPAFHGYLEALTRVGLGSRLMFGSDQMYWPEAIGMAVEATHATPFVRVRAPGHLLQQRGALLSVRA
jgi:uncharacterized protein